MDILLTIILVSYLVVCFVTFSFLKRVKNLIGYHLGMNIAMLSSGVIGISVGTVLGYAYPEHYTVITIVATLIAIIVGVLFGSLVDYQTLLSGVSGGMMAGIMGPMIGMVADLGLLTFCTVLLYLSFGLLCFSVRS